MGISTSFKGFEAFFATLRMFWQMIIKLVIAILVLQVIVIVTIIYFRHDEMYGKIDKIDNCLLRTYLKAKISNKLNFSKRSIDVEYSCEQITIGITYNEFIEKYEPYIINRIDKIKSKTAIICLWTSFLYLLFPVFLFYFNKKHKKDSEDKFIRGAKLIPAEKLKEMIEKRSGNEFKFIITDCVQIPISIINRHCIALGKPGSGKTQLISRIVEQIIKNGYRAIIHDFKGDFITTFYDYRKHFIYNPLDKRHMGLKDLEMDLIERCKDIKMSDLNENIIKKFPEKLINTSKNDLLLPLFEYSYLIDEIRNIVDCLLPGSKYYSIKKDMNEMECKVKGWSIFNELKSSIDIDAFCASLIPESASQDNFWPISSRQLLGAIISYCIYNDITSYADLWRTVNLGNEQLLELFKDTPGCEEGTKLLTEAKTANNILAVLSNYTKPIKYLIGTEGNFSIKEWVKDKDNERKIIFLSNYAMIQETIKPFLTMFADFSIKTLLSLDDDLDRRLFFILDEFGELGKIGTIVPLLTGSRSKGGAGFILIQDTARINTIYGKDGCSTIVNACGNLISFAVKKEEAEFVSQCFGSMEIKRTDESKSMGVSSVNDSISISKQTVEKNIVMASEVTNIPTLGFFIQLTDYDVTRDKLEIINFPKKAQSYIGREDLLFKKKKDQASNLSPGSTENAHSGIIVPAENKQTVQKEEDSDFAETKKTTELNNKAINDASYLGDLEIVNPQKSFREPSLKDKPMGPKFKIQEHPVENVNKTPGSLNDKPDGMVI